MLRLRAEARLLRQNTARITRTITIPKDTIDKLTNLITPLLYEHVPLTNNAAERAIRPLVILRKMTGGCQTIEGAKTHAVNFSIVSTIFKRELPLLDTLKDYLLAGSDWKELNGYFYKALNIVAFCI